MFVCICELYLYLLNNPQSLKDKRAVIKSIKDKIRRRFSVAISEVGDENCWETAVLGIATVSNKKREAEAAISKVIHFVEQNHDLEITVCHTQVAKY